MASVNSSYLSFKYEAFRLKIHSEIELPELSPLKTINYVKIYLDEVYLNTLTVINKGISYKVTENAFYRFWDTIGKL